MSAEQSTAASDLPIVEKPFDESTTTSATTNPPALEKRPSQANLLESLSSNKKQRTEEPSGEKNGEEGTAGFAKDHATGGTSSAEPHLLIKKLSPKAKLPTRGSAFAAGYDMYSSHDTTIPARGKALVDTDISMAVPAGTYGRIAPRSGLASKNFIDVGAGVIDADYRGQVKILLFNHSDIDFVVKEGDRVAQLILEKIYTPEVVEVQELEDSVRGIGGFGSTGN